MPTSRPKSFGFEPRTSRPDLQVHWLLSKIYPNTGIDTQTDRNTHRQTNWEQQTKQCKPTDSLMADIRFSVSIYGGFTALVEPAELLERAVGRRPRDPTVTAGRDRGPRPDADHPVPRYRARSPRGLRADSTPHPQWIRQTWEQLNNWSKTLW